MRAPFQTEDQFLERFRKLSETARFDYKRRLEGANVAALAAALAKEQAGDAEARAGRTRSQLRRANLVAISAISVLGLASLFGDLPNLRTAALLLMGAWVLYLGAVELFLLPFLNDLQTTHWYSYQIHAREWSSLIGAHGFAEHMALVTNQFRGQPSENEDEVSLAIQGFALLKADGTSAR